MNLCLVVCVCVCVCTFNLWPIIGHNFCTDPTFRTFCERKRLKNILKKTHTRGRNKNNNNNHNHIEWTKRPPPKALSQPSPKRKKAGEIKLKMKRSPVKQQRRKTVRKKKNARLFKQSIRCLLTLYHHFSFGLVHSKAAKTVIKFPGLAPDDAESKILINQTDPNSPLYSIGKFEDLKLYAKFFSLQLQCFSCGS